MIKPIVEVCLIKDENRFNQVMQHHRIAISMAGSFAIDMARSLAMGGVPLPECDGAGHQMMRLLTPEEIVTKAVATTEQLFTAIGDKGWITEVPPFSECLRDDSENVGFFRSNHG
jgi:hypothetical protein